MLGRVVGLVAGLIRRSTLRPRGSSPVQVEPKDKRGETLAVQAVALSDEVSSLLCRLKKLTEGS